MKDVRIELNNGVSDTVALTGARSMTMKWLKMLDRVKTPHVHVQTELHA